MFQRILVAVDGSAIAKSAVAPAAEVARAMGVPIHLLRVVNIDYLQRDGAFGVPLRYATLESAVAEERQAANDELTRLQRALQEDRLTVTTEARQGRASEEILATTREGDLIVIASHGRTGLERWFFGSVAEEVVRRSTAPVLLVRSAEVPPSSEASGYEGLSS